MKKFVRSTSLSIAAVTAVVSAVIVPAATFAAVDSKSTTINAVVAPVISMSTSSTVGINIIPTAVGAASSASDTVLVSTNRSTGYTLNLKDADATTSLSTSITAHTGTVAAPTALTTNNTWGFRVDDSSAYTGFGAGSTSAETNVAALTNVKWAGITAAGANIKTTATPGANNSTTVWYAAKVDTTITDGTYSDIVTYTATTN